MKMTTTQRILFRQEVREVGAELEVNDIEARELERLNVAVGSGKSAPIPETQEVVDVVSPQEAVSDAQIKKMNRTNLEEFATSIQFDQDTASFERVADLAAAVIAFRGSTADAGAEGTDE